MPGQAIVTIRDKQWQVSIADTPWELTQGLGGLAELAENTGMFFDTGYEQIIQVTTMPMLFPIDIAFFSESLAVTEVYRNVEPGFIVTPILTARYFIEVNAGELENIEVGDMALVELLSLAEAPPTTTDWTSNMMTFFCFVVMGVFMVAIAKDLLKDTLELEKKPALYGPRGERLLPQTRSAARYEIETDRMGNIIITRTDDSGKDVFLQFESDRALVYDLLKRGERKDLDAGWPIQIKRSEPRASTLDELWVSSAQSQKSPQTRKQKTCRSDVSVDSWEERDRLGIWITDRRTDKVIAEWWDDDARQMFEDGFFKMGKQLNESVLDYAESVGILAKEGLLRPLPEKARNASDARSSAIIPSELPQRRHPIPDELEFLPDSPEFLAYTIDDIGYRDRIDSAFLSAIKRAKGE